jgi:hypothetical protein
VALGEKPNEPTATVRPLVFSDTAPQPKQEQVEHAAEIVCDALGCLITQWADWWTPNEGDKLYTHPQPKQEQDEPVAVVTGAYGGRFTYAPLKDSVILPVGMAFYSSPQQRKPLTDEQKLDLVTNWFSDDWAIEYALNLLHDYEIKAAHGIKG